MPTGRGRTRYDPIAAEQPPERPSSDALAPRVFYGLLLDEVSGRRQLVKLLVFVGKITGLVRVIPTCP